uniref:Secreted protein n=1 Tax=Globodera pallida TaxID=36090 RepID=A0A183CCG8_GLOPA
MINIYPIYSIKMTFVSILILIALILEVQVDHDPYDPDHTWLIGIRLETGGNGIPAGKKRVVPILASANTST